MITIFITVNHITRCFLSWMRLNSITAFSRYEDYFMYINLTKVKVSSGTLFYTDEANVELTEEGMLEFSWDPQILEKGSTKDQVMYLAYDIEAKRAYHSIVGQFRYIGKDSLRISKKKGRTYHLYIAFNAYELINQTACIWEQ